MSKKVNFQGKRGGSHTTVINGAVNFINDLAKEETVTRISPGYITSGKKVTPQPAVKVIDENGGLLLSFRTGCSFQEVRVLTTRRATTKAKIVEIVREYGFRISHLDRTQAHA